MGSKILFLLMLIVGGFLTSYCVDKDIEPILLMVISLPILLIMSSLLLGYFIGWKLRRRRYKERYEEEIDDLMYEDDKSLILLKKQEIEVEAIARQFVDAKESLRIKKERLNTYEEEDKKLRTEIAYMEHSNRVLSEKIPLIDIEIGHSLENLASIKEVRNEFLEKIEKVNQYEHDTKVFSDDVVSFKSQLPTVKKRQEMFVREIEYLERALKREEDHFSNLEIELEIFREEYRNKKFSLIREIEEGEEKEQRYDRALRFIEKQIKDRKKVSFSEVDYLIENGQHSSLGWAGRMYKKTFNFVTKKEDLND